MDIGNIFNEYDEGFLEGRITAFDDVICALDTLEVKKADLEKEIISWEDIPQLISIAERLRTDVYISTKRITREEFYKEVLKRFKNMKGK